MARRSTTEAPDDSGVSVESTVALVANLRHPPESDRFPTLPSDDPRAAASTATYGGQLGWDNPATAEALVAYISSDTMTGAIQLQALASFDSRTYSTPARDQRRWN